MRTLRSCSAIRRLLVVSLLLVLGVMATDSARGEARKLIGDNFLNVGNAWRYSVRSGTTAVDKLTIQVVGTQTIAGYPVAVVQLAFVNYGYWATVYWYMTADHVVEVRYEEPYYIEQVRDNDPIELYPRSVTCTESHAHVGHGHYDAWDLIDPEFNAVGEQDSYVTCLGPTTVVVPLGSFECVGTRIEETWQERYAGGWQGAGGQQEVFWFSPAIGLVKAYIEDENQTWELEWTNVAYHTVTVASAPVSNVPITGDSPGVTPYTVIAGQGDMLNLTAPAEATQEPSVYAFAKWSVDGLGRPRGQTNVKATVTGSYTLDAVYESSPPPAVTDLSAELAGVELHAVAVTSSGDYSADYSAGNAIDGNAATYWNGPFRSAPQEEFLRLDFGSVGRVDSVGLLPSAAFPMLFPSSFSVEVSEDAQNWRTVASEASYTPQSGTWHRSTFSAQAARYVRLRVPQTPLYQGGIYTIQVAEFTASCLGALLTFTSRGGVIPSVRYSDKGPITTEEQWNAATPVNTSATAEDPGVRQSIPVALADPPGETRVYFALRTTDMAGGVSPLSNPADVVTTCIPPGPVTDLRVEAAMATGNSLTVRFTATGDDGQVGTAARYDLRWSKAPLTPDTWANATSVSDPPPPQPAGNSEAITISGLEGDTAYYIALKVRDEVECESLLSNVVTGKTKDVIPPAAIGNLTAALVSLTPAKSPVSVTASSGEYGPGYGAANAIDGDPATYWSTPARTAPQAEYLTLDLGEPTTLQKVRLLPSSLYHYLFHDSFKIEVSTDNASWTELASESAYSAVAGVWYEKTFTGQSARYVRVAIAATMLFQPGIYFIAIAEFEAYRAGGQVVQLTWTSPGDNGSTGTATGYSVRCVTAPATTGKWASAAGLTGPPTPASAGTAQTMTMSLALLPKCPRVYFALKTTDEASNESDMSNTPYLDKPGPADLPGDATCDCRVNILDLIFVRERLNQSVSSDDNILADVTGDGKTNTPDGKINILDLIYVRGRLNTICLQ